MWDALRLLFKRKGFKRSTIKYCKIALQLKPKNLKIIKNLIGLLIDTKKYKQAIKVCKSALMLYPDNVDIWMCLGDAHNSLKNINETIEAYGSCLKKDPRNTIVANKLGKVYDKEGRPDKALKIFEYVLGLRPNDGTALEYVKYIKKQKEDEWLRKKITEIIEGPVGVADILETNNGYTYFIQSSYNRLIKIGYSRKIKTRMKDLQNSSPDELILLLLIKGNREKELHEKFRPYRKHGEWFEPSREILQYLLDLIVKNKNVILIDDDLE